MRNSVSDTFPFCQSFHTNYRVTHEAKAAAKWLQDRCDILQINSTIIPSYPFVNGRCVCVPGRQMDRLSLQTPGNAQQHIERAGPAEPSGSHAITLSHFNEVKRPFTREGEMDDEERRRKKDVVTVGFPDCTMTFSQKNMVNFL